MEINGNLNCDNLKLYEAPPVAFVNYKQKFYNKIKVSNRFSILSKPKIKEQNKLKIDITPEALEKQSNQVLLEIINFIRNFCSLSINSVNFILLNKNFEIKKVEDEFQMVLKDNSFKIIEKITKKEMTDFYCPNHNKYFKTKESLQSHIKSAHIFKCDNCGAFFSKKEKLEKHLKYNCHKIKKYNFNNSSTNNNCQNNNNIIKNTKYDENIITKHKKYIPFWLLKNRNKKRFKDIKDEQEKKEEKDSEEGEKQEVIEKNKNQKIKISNEKYGNNHSFYCNICKKCFASSQALKNHNFSKNHK